MVTERIYTRNGCQLVECTQSYYAAGREVALCTWWAGALALLFAASLGLSQRVIGQAPAPSKPGETATLPKPITAAEAENFAPLHRSFYLVAVRGSDWLAKQQRADGSFPAGFLPSLNMVLEGEHYLRQVQATLALAQAARLSANEKWSAQAKQAVLWLLAGTATDSQQPTGRAPRPPLVLMSRLSATGLLLAAIHELPQPAHDLLHAAEELAYWVQRQQQADGTFRLGEVGLVGMLPNGIPEETDPGTFGPGQALWGLARSYRLRPQVWKMEVLRRARQPYIRAIRNTPSSAEPPNVTNAPGEIHHRPMMAVWHLAAWAEAYSHTRERLFAEYVFELADGLLALQYTDATKPMYLGGFSLSLVDKAKHQPPDWQTAYFAWALTLAARTARLANEQARYTRYVLAAEGALQFLTTLQYTALNTSHFAESYQPKVIGAFRTGLHTGAIRVEAQQAVLTALWTYLETIVCAR